MKIVPLIEIAAKKHSQMNQGTFTYDVRVYVGRYLGQAAFDFIMVSNLTKKLGR